MITFYSENDFSLRNKKQIEAWLNNVIASEGKKLEELSYVFCSDAYLLNINQKYLDHDTYTDIISFDYSYGNTLIGEIYISTERVQENADQYKVAFKEELLRVLAHGALHLCGYKDKTKDEAAKMRLKENEKIAMFHVEH